LSALGNGGQCRAVPDRVFLLPLFASHLNKKTYVFMNSLSNKESKWGCICFCFIRQGRCVRVPERDGRDGWIVCLPVWASTWSRSGAHSTSHPAARKSRRRCLSGGLAVPCRRWCTLWQTQSLTPLLLFQRIPLPYSYASSGVRRQRTGPW